MMKVGYHVLEWAPSVRTSEYIEFQTSNSIAIIANISGFLSAGFLRAYICVRAQK